MKGRTVFFTVAAVGLWLAVAAPSHASTITTPGPGTGLTYEFGVTMNGNDSAIYEGNVGAKSWNEPLQPLGEKGWTHTTDWTALTLNEAADLTVTLARTTAGGGLLTPAFTIYSGQEHVESDSTHHTFNNIGNIAWTTALTYMDHEANLGRAASISKTFSLGPGAVQPRVRRPPHLGSDRARSVGSETERPARISGDVDDGAGARACGSVALRQRARRAGGTCAATDDRVDSEGDGRPSARRLSPLNSGICTGHTGASLLQCDRESGRAAD